MRIITFLAAAMTAIVCSATVLISPDGNIVVNVDVNQQGTPVYSVTYKDTPIVTESKLGFVAVEGNTNARYVTEPSAVTEFDETWQPVWGEYADVRNHYNEQTFKFTSPGGINFDVCFRVFDDGLGFRYHFPKQDKGVNITLTDELTQFNLADDYTLFCIPGDYDTDEFLYTTSAISDLPQKMHKVRHTEGTHIDGLAIQTPVMMKHPEGKVYVNLHEAALVGYPMMALNVDSENKSLSTHLTPDKQGVRAHIQVPFSTPWRTMIISDDARDILASQLIYNLNDSCAIEDTSWIKPTKFMGVWWEMFLGGNSWAYSDDVTAKPGITDYSTLTPNGRHSANNENVKRYIDFASQHNIPALLVEGWNQGWEDWGNRNRNRHFRFDLSYPDFDVDSLQAYAKERGVKLIMHHETSANAADYERQLEDAFNFMNQHGYDAVKTGYVGYINPRNEYHSSQWMVDHYLEVAKRAANHRIMVDSHEAVRPTGLARTWPNWIAQESARGGEYEAMGGNPPEHTTILPFTRLKGGPMDYTPGVFETDLSTYGYGNTTKAGTTIARQLALYLTMPSPLQMACDLPQTYEKYLDAFKFIEDVPVDWADSRYLEAEPGEYITVARKDKASDDWYLGAVTDEKARKSAVKLDFLPAGQKFVAKIYEDAPDADYRTNPKAYRIREQKVDNKTTLKFNLAPGGGMAVRLTPVYTHK